MRQKSFNISIFVTLFILGIVAGVACAAYIARQPPSDEAAQLKQTLPAPGPGGITAAGSMAASGITILLIH